MALDYIQPAVQVRRVAKLRVGMAKAIGSTFVWCRTSEPLLRDSRDLPRSELVKLFASP